MKIVTMLIFLLCFSWHLFADEAEAKTTAKVIDESRNPINDVNIKFGYEHLKTLNPWDGRTTTKIEGKTESGGIFTASSNGLPRIAITATKDGYYRSYKEYEFKNSENGKWQPWNPNVDIVLRKIVNPVPMYMKDLSYFLIPIVNEPIGYDLLVGDWVKPYGKGNIDDITVLFNLDCDEKASDPKHNPVPPHHYKKYKYQMEIRTNHNGDGFCPISESSIIPESGLKFPYEAPENGYLKNIVFKVDSENEINTQEPNGDYFYIRIRTELDGNGNVIKGMYGKFLFTNGINKCSMSRKDGVTKGDISFTYYINPDYTRNIEFDSKRNLFKRLAAPESVHSP
ncbi:MAG: hypothetical protein NT118_08405 [Lentisphaerae bacterium]|nr:hypothetical protein [Lentisphaerota bacterium]